jgi:hypothetical protein
MTLGAIFGIFVLLTLFLVPGRLFWLLVFLELCLVTGRLFWLLVFLELCLVTRRLFCLLVFLVLSPEDFLGFLSFLLTFLFLSPDDSWADPAPEGYISYPYIPKSPKKDISYHFLEKDILGI